LTKNFVDKDAEFLFVPSHKVESNIKPTQNQLVELIC